MFIVTHRMASCLHLSANMHGFENWFIIILTREVQVRPLHGSPAACLYFTRTVLLPCDWMVFTVQWSESESWAELRFRAKFLRLCTPAENAHKDRGGGGGGGGWDPARPSPPAHPPLQPQRSDREEVSAWPRPLHTLNISCCADGDGVSFHPSVTRRSIRCTSRTQTWWRRYRPLQLTHRMKSVNVWYKSETVCPQSCAEDEEEEEEGKEKTFEVLHLLHHLHSTRCHVNTGGEIKSENRWTSPGL